ncbi:PD-(D/E)XK nuclease family protein [Bacillus sp. JCM 19034]|uniref:PD-(D/E)XK nuclease family protein n=1 Tax=Bacillus sp. JCM 19034 TaxID=1481928 RepID=UPI00078242C2|nr:PD-(D/E)XK nuclease family protein [Bacillus sp. JCM 19034]
MGEQIIVGTALQDVASQIRLEKAYKRQQKENKPAFYLLPSYTWMKKAREVQPGLMICTFDDLATYILEQTNCTYLPLTEQERTLFFQQFVKHERSFEQEWNLAKARAYADTYGQIKRLGLSLDRVTGSLKTLIPLFKKYEQEIVQNKQMLDPENQILHAIERLKNIKEIHLSVVVIDGFFDFSPLQSLLIEALCRLGVRIEIILPYEKSFEIVEQTVAELVEIGFDNHLNRCERNVADSDKLVVSATTAEEQWRGLMEEISHCDALEEIGIVIVDEQEDIQELQRYAEMYSIPLQIAKKRSLSTTAIFSFVKMAIEAEITFTKWDKLPKVEQILKLYHVSGLAYSKQKQQFIKDGDWTEEKYELLYDKLNELRWPTEGLFTEYLSRLLSWLRELPLMDYWMGKLKGNESPTILKKIADEYKALDLIERKVEAELAELVEKEIDVSVTHDLFVEWFRELGLITTIFKERAQNKGVAVHTWRDVRSFSGKRLYVVGMNEGSFPARHRLSGYVTERDLMDLSIRYSPPTQKHFQLKQDAYFEQLDYLGIDQIVFTYVKGVDPEHPHHPSPYIVDYDIEKEWTWLGRMQKDVSVTEQSYIDMIAVKIGEGYKVEPIPSTLSDIKKHQLRLTDAKERLSVEYATRRKKHIVAVTELESYARCSFRYALDRELKVGELKEKQSDVSPLTIGQIVHSLIEGVYKDCQLINREFGSVSEKELQHVPIRLRERFEEKWLEVEKENVELSRFHLVLKKEQWQQRLSRWWQAELKHFWHNNALASMKIVAFEHPIRFELPLSEEESIILVGKVDRVDRKEDSIVIYDYKTGLASIKMDEVQSGLKLQLPLYAYALREQYERNEKKKIFVDGASYISLKEPDKRSNNGIWRVDLVGKDSPYHVSSFCKNKEEEFGTRAFLDKYQITEQVATLWEGMSQFYDVAPQECSSFCPYISICRATPEQRQGKQ